MENVFRTKLGYCHVFPDKIILNNSLDPKIRSASSDKNTIGWRLMFYALLTVYILYKSVQLYMDGEMFRFSLHAAAGLVLGYTTIKGINNTTVGLIERSKIREVIFKEASFLTRAHLSILFEDSKGKLKKRLIMLPGSLSGGKEETKKAERIMLIEGYINP